MQDSLLEDSDEPTHLGRPFHSIISTLLACAVKADPRPEDAISYSDSIDTAAILTIALTVARVDRHIDAMTNVPVDAIINIGARAR